MTPFFYKGVKFYLGIRPFTAKAATESPIKNQQLVAWVEDFPVKENGCYDGIPNMQYETFDFGVDDGESGKFAACERLFQRLSADAVI